MSDEATEDSEDFDDELVTLLRTAVQASGLRQAQAAERIGCSQSVMSRMLNGRPVGSKLTAAARSWALAHIGELESGEVTAEMEAPEWGSSSEEGETPEVAPEKASSAAPEPRPATRAREATKDKRPPSSAGLTTPYEAVLRTMLEKSAQEHFEQIAGEAGKGIRVRVTLEWD